MIEAYVLVMAAAGTAHSLRSQLEAVEGVSRANIVAGEFDIIALVEAASPRDLLALVTDDIQTLDGVGRTRTCIVLD